MGTAAYMSPEQARGKTVDKRADIWAFGAVLFEMLIGEKAFDGQDISQTLARVIEREPDLSSLPPATPAALRRLLRLCLEKDPKRRLRDIGDALRDLEDARTRTAELVPGSVSLPVRARSWSAVAVVGAVLAAGLVGYFLRSFPSDSSRSTIPRLVNAIQVTSSIGVEYPALLPDAEWLAYSFEEGGNSDIWVLQLGAGQAVNRTSDNLGSDSWPSWSPDGRQIAFNSDNPGEQAVWVMDAFAGAPRRVASGGTDFAPLWSGDGSRLAYGVDDETETRGTIAVEILHLQTGDTHRITLPGDRSSRHDLTWSHDERFFAYLDTSSRRTEAHSIWLMRSEDGVATPITNSQTSDWSPAFAPDGSRLFYASNRGIGFDLWQRLIDDDGNPQGEPQPVTSGMQILHVTLSRDGTKLAYVKGRRVTNFLWRVPILEDRAATWADAEQLTFDRAYVNGFDISPDGERIILSTDRSGSRDLWVMPLDGRGLTQLTTEVTPEWQPAWSPDGQQVAFHGMRSGNRDIWIMPADGGQARQITTSDATDWQPVWSPDGQSVVFGSDRNDRNEIWVISTEGGEAKRVARGQRPTWAPDGRSIVFGSDQTGDYGLWRVPVTGGEPQRLTGATAGTRPTFSSDGGNMYFARDDNLWVISGAEGAEKQLTDFRNKYGGIRGTGFDTDGQNLYFVCQEDEGDIWIADLVYDGASDQ